MEPPQTQTQTPPPTLTSSVSGLQSSLSTLHPQLSVLTTSLSSSSTESLHATQSHLSDASSILHRLLSFLNTSTRRGSAPSPARENGELQSLLAHLFGAFALAEGEALAATQASEAALSSIESFKTSRVSPLLREFSGAKERALVQVARATTKVAVANESKMHMELKLQGNRESVEATSKHLDEVQATLNTMAYKMEALVEKKQEMEERKLEAKERRELQRSQKAVGFLSIFVPVLAPVAAAAAVFSSRALDGELRRAHNQLEILRRQTSGLNPALIENALKGLNLEHATIQAELEQESAVVTTLSAEKSALERQLEELEEVHETLDAVCAELARTQSVVAETAAKVGDAAAKAATAKGVCAQGVVNSCRMSLEEGRRWVVGLLEGVVETVGEGREELEACKVDVQQEVPVDEAFESGGESPLVGRKESGEWEGPELLAVVEAPEEEERECEHEGEERDTCECEEESDEEVPETVDVGVETPVHEEEDEEEAEREIIDAVHPADGPAEEYDPILEHEHEQEQEEEEEESAVLTSAFPLEREPSVPGSYQEDSEDEDSDGEYSDDEVEEEDEGEGEEAAHHHHHHHQQKAYPPSITSSILSSSSSESHVQDASKQEIHVLGSSTNSSPSPSDDEHDEDSDDDDEAPGYEQDLAQKCRGLVNVQIAPVPELPEVHEIEVGMPGSFH